VHPHDALDPVELAHRHSPVFFAHTGRWGGGVRET
jgi:hypothetical protein